MASSYHTCRLPVCSWLGVTVDLQFRVTCITWYVLGYSLVASGNYDELSNLVQEMAELGATDNPYSALTPQVHFK